MPYAVMGFVGAFSVIGHATFPYTVPPEEIKIILET